MNDESYLGTYSRLVPNAAKIANLLAIAQRPCTAILKHLADLSLFGVTRAANNAYFPASLLLSVCYQHSRRYKDKAYL